MQTNPHEIKHPLQVKAQKIFICNIEVQMTILVIFLALAKGRLGQKVGQDR